MYRPKKINREVNRKKFFKKANPAPPEYQLTHTWHNNTETQAVPGMCLSTIMPPEYILSRVRCFRLQMIGKRY
jgi:hypothetical protein